MCHRTNYARKLEVKGEFGCRGEHLVGSQKGLSNGKIRIVQQGGRYCSSSSPNTS
jgi:hypothetical protein